jgi:hypothetical protein
MGIRRPMIAGVFVFAAAGLARAGEIQVPGDFRRLQDALDAASPGDTVVVSGRHRGPFHCATAGVSIEGSGALLLGGRGKVREALVLSSDGVTVRGLRFRGGGVRVDGGAARVEGNSVERLRDAAGIVVHGEGAAVAGNSVERVRGGDAIAIQGDGAVVEGNRVARVVLGTGIGVVGRGARIAGCAVDDIAAGDGISVHGPGFTVHGNRLGAVGRILVTRQSAWLLADPMLGRAPLRPRACPAIRVHYWDSREPGGIVSGNEIEHFASNGIQVEIAGVTVSGNDIVFAGERRAGAGPTEEDRWIGGDAIAVFGDDAVIAGNIADGDGILVFGDGIRVEGNTVVDGSSEFWRLPREGEGDASVWDTAGIVVQGTEIALEGNRVRGGVHGIFLNAPGSVSRGDTVTACGGDAFLVAADASMVLGVLAMDAGGAGLRCTGQGAGACDSTFSGSGEVDVVVDAPGWFTLFEGNTFGTGEPGPVQPWLTGGPPPGGAATWGED